MCHFLAGLVLLALGLLCVGQSIALTPQQRVLLATHSKGPVSIAANSLALVSASSQSLTATGKVGINQQKFTFATWFKTSTGAGNLRLFTFGDGTTANNITALIAAGKISFGGNTASAATFSLVSSATYSDGNWHSLVLGMDTTQATANSRGIIWVDGAQATLGTNTQPAQNTNLSTNFAATYRIGANQTPAQFFNGNLAQLYYIDGQQLAPTSFITGAPGVPKAYGGTYAGTFDFFLNFSNSGSLGADSSGEGNSWTPQNSPTQSSDHP